MRVLHPRLPDHDHGRARREPRPDARRGERDHRRQPVPLYRLPEHRQGGAARGRAAARPGRPGRDRVTSFFGEPIVRLEDDRLLRGHGGYLDDLGHDALAVAFVRSPHAHARIAGIDVSGALDVDGLVAVYTYEDLPGRLAEPL